MPPSRGRTSTGSGLSLQLGLSARVHRAMNTHVTFVQMGGAIDKVGATRGWLGAYPERPPGGRPCVCCVC
jgi:hypothetical protein